MSQLYHLFTTQKCTSKQNSIQLTPAAYPGQALHHELYQDKMAYDKLGNSTEVLAPLRPSQNSTSLANLPTELLIQIFSHLDPFDLDHNIGNVCKNWHYIINNNQLWKETFKRRFGTVNFSPLKRSKIWKDEYILREALLKKWSKGLSIHKNYMLQSSLPQDTEIAADFVNDKLVAFSPNIGVLNICKLSDGKNSAHIPVVSPELMSAFKLTKTNFLFALQRFVYVKQLASKSYLSDAVMLKGEPQHEDLVSAVECIENVSGKDGIVGCITGDLGGTVKFWDMKNFNLLYTMQISQNDPVLQVKSNFKDIIVVVCLKLVLVLRVNLIQPDVYSSVEVSFLALPSVNNQSDNFRSELQVDFGAEQIVYHTSDTLYVVSFHKQSFGTVKSHWFGKYAKIDQIAVDLNVNKEYNHSLTGNDGSMVGVVLESGLVTVFNTRLVDLNPLLIIRPHIKAEFSYISSPIRSILIRSCIVVLGSFNGSCSIYNVLTGNFMRTGSVRIPRRLIPMEYNIEVQKIILNQDEFCTNGISLCGNVIQYFQFGDLSNVGNGNGAKKLKASHGSDRKRGLERGIKLALNDLQHEELMNEQQARLVEKYNGLQDLDVGEELEFAILLSESLAAQEQDRDRAEIEEEEERILAEILEHSQRETSRRPNHVNIDEELDEGSSSARFADTSAGLESYDELLERALKLSLEEL